MSHEKLRPEFLFDEEKIKQLKQIAPECFEDGKINFETLKQNLGEWAQDEDGELEHFGLFWPGKKDARRIAAIPPEGTLVPVYGEGLKADGTPDDDGMNDSKNIFIEGENLEVLKILQKSYAGKIKMIYIDPPYNTGKDFIYEDNFTEGLQEYLRRTGQVDEEGKALTSNKRADGRFHSKWLSMIYPRLRLAKTLLKDNGIIFCSIDDNEVSYLRALLNEIMGEENFISQTVWNLKSGTQAGHFTRSHEYVLIYANNKELLPYFKDKSGGTIKHGALKKISTKNPSSEITFPAGMEIEADSGKFSGEVGDSEKQYLKQDMIFEDRKLVHDITIEAGWAMKDQVLNWLDGKETFDSKGQKVLKFYFNSQGILWYEKERGTYHPKTVLDDVVGNTKKGSDQIIELFGEKLFDFPKPTSLIKFLAKTNVDNTDIVLDFFAGSGSTGQALYEYCESEEVNAKFILVQLDEPIDPDDDLGKKAIELGYSKISEVSSDRLKKFIAKNSFSNINDKGFLFRKLTRSNYKTWANYSGTSVSELEKNLDLFNQEPLREGWTKEGLLTEIILIEGFVLSSTIEHQAQYTKNEVKKVSDEYCEHSLLVCLDEKINPDTIDSLELSGNDIFICLDSAISNVEKLRLSDKGLIKTI